MLACHLQGSTRNGAFATNVKAVACSHLMCIRFDDCAVMMFCGATLVVFAA